MTQGCTVRVVKECLAERGSHIVACAVSHCCMIASHDVNALTGAFHLRGPAQDNGITPFDFSFEHLSFSSVVSRPTSAALRHLARVIGF